MASNFKQQCTNIQEFLEQANWIYIDMINENKKDWIKALWHIQTAFDDMIEKAQKLDIEWNGSDK